jgi:hypothetical protein
LLILRLGVVVYVMPRVHGLEILQA